MAKIRAFRGIRYNPERISDMSRVVTPPYDVIKGEAQETFYEYSEYNIIRLDYGKEHPGDNERENKYTRAAELFAKWLTDGVLIRDEKPGIYIYEQIFETPWGKRLSRRGFIAALKIEEFDKGIVLPHERTLSKPKADRLDLMRACNNNFSQVFGLYSDPKMGADRMIADVIDSSLPDVEFADEDGVIHRLFCVFDDDRIDVARRVVADIPIYIADGHHRYETALNYRNEMREKSGRYGGDEPFDYVMMMFVNMDSEGLVVYPTHRLIHSLPADRMDGLLERLDDDFIVEPVVEPENVGPEEASASLDARVKRYINRLGRAGERGPSFGLYMGKERDAGNKGDMCGSGYYILTLKDIKRADHIIGIDKPEALRRLDVTILHALVLDRFLGIDAENLANQVNIKYTRDDIEAFEIVDRGECQISFLMNPTKVEEVREVANAGEVMPQKSTYFYPKLYTGLVINLLEE